MANAKIIVVGAGFAGIAAAVAARKAGGEVLLLERTDLLSGAGLRAGRMNYNGKLVGAEEGKALGGGEVFEALESIVLHRANIVDEENGYIYNVAKVDLAMRRLLAAWGVDTRTESRATDVKKKGNLIEAVVLDGGEEIEGDVFVDATGTYGGLDVCTQYGNGCSMCIYRCVTFGNRVSIAARAGAPEIPRTRPDGRPGASDSAMMLHKASLAPALKERLEKEGAVTIPLPAALIDYSKQQKMGAVRTRRQMENLNLVDVAVCAKAVGIGHISLDDLRKIPGLEEAILEHPIGGGTHYCVSKVAMTFREPCLQLTGFPNIFAAGEKAGPGGGIVEVITLGILAGNNAVRQAVGRPLLVLPRTTLIGDFIAYTGEMMKTDGGMRKGYSYAHDVYFERMRELGFYTKDISAIHQRVARLGLTNVLAEKVA